jgi:hypothetical protein
VNGGPKPLRGKARERAWTNPKPCNVAKVSTNSNEGRSKSETSGHFVSVSWVLSFGFVWDLGIWDLGVTFPL